jgi:hypothetical protein
MAQCHGYRTVIGLNVAYTWIIMSLTRKYMKSTGIVHEDKIFGSIVNIFHLRLELIIVCI